MPRQNKIVIRNGTTTPSAGDFDTAEPAWDATNGKLYIKDGAGSMVEIGAGGGGSGPILESQQTISADYTLSSSYNGLSAGPVEVAAGFSVTVPVGATWAIV
jgi:hypothetical protein